MSQRDCVHTGVKLPDLTTCGGLCEAFPACLPPLPGMVQTELVRRLEGSSVEKGRAHLEFLTRLRAALDEGS